MPDAEKKAMVELLAEHDVPLIEDDVYGDMYFGAERPRVAKAYDRKGLVLLCSSYSKDLAPGYRVGWIAPGRYKQKIMRLKAATNIATATLPSYAIADYMENGGYDHHLRRIAGPTPSRWRGWWKRPPPTFRPGRAFPSRRAGLWCGWSCLAQSIRLPCTRMLCRRALPSPPGRFFSARQKYRNFMRLNYAYLSHAVQGSGCHPGPAGLQGYGSCSVPVNTQATWPPTLTVSMSCGGPTTSTVPRPGRPIQ